MNLALVIPGTLLATTLLSSQVSEEPWLRWDVSRSRDLARSTYVQGRIGGIFDTRILATERSYNYKLAATWMTPEVIRATARTLQVSERLSDDEARALVREAEQARGTVIMVEIDPREGSGIIPDDWSAFLQASVAEGVVPRPARGVETPALKQVKALAGVMRRNYDYDRFWVVFPLTHSDGQPLFRFADREAELVVRISGREGRVKWSIPAVLKTSLDRENKEDAALRASVVA